MNIVIKKNTTRKLVVDPRKEGDKQIDWDDFLTNAVVTFSMIDVETGCYAIANRPAEIVVGGVTENDDSQAPSVSCAEDTTNLYLSYNFRTTDTKKNGVYSASFQINSLISDEVVSVPQNKEMQVFIVGSSVSPSRVYAGLPEIPANPNSFKIYFGSSAILPQDMMNAVTSQVFTQPTYSQLGFTLEERADRLLTKNYDCSGGKYVYILWPLSLGTTKPTAYSPVDFRIFSAMYLNQVTIKDGTGVDKEYILLNTPIQSAASFYLRLIS